jgi:hypothetical protein
MTDARVSDSSLDGCANTCISAIFLYFLYGKYMFYIYGGPSSKCEAPVVNDAKSPPEPSMFVAFPALFPISACLGHWGRCMYVRSFPTVALFFSRSSESHLTVYYSRIFPTAALFLQSHFCDRDPAVCHGRVSYDLFSMVAVLASCISKAIFLLRCF